MRIRKNQEIEVTGVFDKIRMMLLIRSAKRMLRKKYFKIRRKSLTERCFGRFYKRGKRTEVFPDESSEDYLYDEYDADEEEESVSFFNHFSLQTGISNRKSLEKFFHERYEPSGFADALNRYMHEKDMTTGILYTRCFIDRKLVSKIVSNPNYHPSKETVFALCIGLRLNYRESEHFLGLAGYTFNPNSKYDLLIEFSIKNRVYDIDQVNEILYAFHEPCFGE